MQNYSPFYSPTPKRPLLGMTILVVEDSKYACDGLRLMCLHSGARIRRADSLTAARRHLKVYRPSAAIIDIGLPDGSGTELIQELANQSPRISVILGISGDDMIGARTKDIGADGFLVKPLKSLATFQEEILKHVPSELLPTGPRKLNDMEIEAGQATYHDDLLHVSNLIDDCKTDDSLHGYVIQFLKSIATAASDTEIIKHLRGLSGKKADKSAILAVLSNIQYLIAKRHKEQISDQHLTVTGL